MLRDPRDFFYLFSLHPHSQPRPRNLDFLDYNRSPQTRTKTPKPFTLLFEGVAYRFLIDLLEHKEDEDPDDNGVS